MCSNTPLSDIIARYLRFSPIRLALYQTSLINQRGFSTYRLKSTTYPSQASRYPVAVSTPSQNQQFEHRKDTDATTKHQVMRFYRKPPATSPRQSSEQAIVYHKTKFPAGSSELLDWNNLKQLLPLTFLFIASLVLPFQWLPRPYVQAHVWISQGVALLLFACLLGVIYRIFQNQQAKLVEELRTKLSADLHDEVGSVLSGIAMQAELLEISLDEEHKTPLQKLAVMSRQAMAQMRDTVWALDARKDNWGGLVDRLHDHAAELLEPKQIAFTLEIQGINRQKPLSPDLRQHLYLIGKEAITNAAKHSNGDQLQILLLQQGDLLEMFIQDNGELAQSSKRADSGLGLSNIRLRAKELGAQLSIQQSNGFGIALSFKAAS